MYWTRRVHIGFKPFTIFLSLHWSWHRKALSTSFTLRFHNKVPVAFNITINIRKFSKPQALKLVYWDFPADIQTNAQLKINEQWRNLIKSLYVTQTDCILLLKYSTIIEGDLSNYYRISPTTGYKIMFSELCIILTCTLWLAKSYSNSYETSKENLNRTHTFIIHEIQ